MVEEEPVSKEAEMNHNQNGEVVIRRGRVGSISLFEITDAELQTIEHGAPSGTLINTGFFAGSACLSFLSVLLTTPIASDRLFYVYFIICILSGAVSIICFLVARKMKGSLKELLKAIKARVPGIEVEKVSSGRAVRQVEDDPDSQDPA
ncbi:hypothetical protein IRZ48_05435 [Pseudomonas fulva]|uniref:hypothetical protein n=1 Tax=Pseudomonas fulva TaxID=47880 RepID=UPI0018AA75E4|nr:hypothetical protein [Pseudomonas fulva]MBF8636102.1 hypothetical protein [Pseudomonas fulva]MBF8688044.1 hypothetical protein [Pseudomonas fulva]